MTDVTLMWRDPRDGEHEDARFAFTVRNCLRAEFLPATRTSIDTIAARCGFVPHRRLSGVRVSTDDLADQKLVDAMRADGWDPESHGWIQNHLT